MENKLALFLNMVGADKLAIEVQDAIKNDMIMLINGPGDYNANMNMLFENLGADKLPKDIQTDLREKIDLIVNMIRENKPVSKDIFKWNSISESAKPVHEVKKDQWKWQSGLAANESVNVDSSTKKICKDQFRWPKDIKGMGSHIVDEASAAGASSMFFGAWHRPASVIYIDSMNKKILFSPNPNFPQGSIFNETMSKTAGDQGYSVTPVDTSKHGWKEQMMKRANGRK